MSNSEFASIVSNIRGKWKAHDYIRLSVFIIATSLVLYWPFVFGDKVFVFYDSASDTIEQYTKVYEFLASTIRNGELTSYTFQEGYGNLTFYMIQRVANPFEALVIMAGIIFGQEYIYESIIFALILKQLCAGLLCFNFLRNFKLSTCSSMISSYLYAFSGYFALIGEHYGFAKNPVYLMLVLIFVEKTLKEDSKVKYWIGLLYSSVLVVLGGVVCTYEIFFAAGVYALFRALYLYGKNFKKIIQRLGICLTFVVGGVGISSVLLFPCMEKITQSSRLIMSSDILAWNAAKDVRTGVLRLFSNFLDGYANGYFGSWFSTCPKFSYFFSVLLIPILAQFIVMTFKDNFSRKEKFFRLLPIFALIFAIVDRFMALFFSFFVPHYDSYIYVFYPLFSFVFADVLDKVKKGKFSRITNYWSMLVSTEIIMWGGITTYNKGLSFILIIAILSAAFLIIGCFLLDILYLVSNNIEIIQPHNIKKMVCITLFGILVLNSFFENYIMFYYQRKTLTKSDVHAPLIISEATRFVNSYEKENFVRFETNYNQGKTFNDYNDVAGRMYGYAYPLMAPMRGTSYFDSAISNGIPEFYEKIFSPSFDTILASIAKTNYQTACKSVQNNVVEDILGIKYLLKTTDFSRNGWNKIEEYPEQGVSLYKNSGINSAGLLFNSYVTQKEADEMSHVERALGLATRLIINNPAENIDDFAVKYSKDSDANDSTKTEVKNAVVVDNSFSMYNGVIDNVEITDDGYNVKATMNTNASNLIFSVKTDIINNRKNSSQVTFRLKDNSFVNNIVYFDADNGWKEISVTPQNVNGEWEYTFMIPQTASALAICGKTQCQYEVNISSKTVTSTYVNEGIQLDNPKRGNIVSGTVNAQKNSLLYLPIPYNKYWNAYIDGEKVDIMKANYAFMAVPIASGQHTVTFIYSNKTYHTFLKVSVATFIIYNSFFVFCLVVKYRRKKKGENK